MARQEPSPSKTSSLLQQILYLLLCSFWQYSACQRIGDEALDLSVCMACPNTAQNPQYVQQYGFAHGFSDRHEVKGN